MRRIRSAWAWLIGLRITTASKQRRLEGNLVAARESAKRARKAKLEAMRALAVLSEPLKDLDLDDWVLSADHRAALMTAYHQVARVAADARMSTLGADWFHAQTRRPGRPTRTPLDPRRLP